MDLLTPAQKWAKQEQSADREIDHHEPDPHRMPLPQQLTMFFSVVGPIAGLIIAIALLWHRGPASIGWPEMIAMLGMYALTGFGVTIGYHRLFTHRSFETNRFVRIWLAVWGSMAGQGALIRWCATASPASPAGRSRRRPALAHHHGEASFELLRGHVARPRRLDLDRDCPDLARSSPTCSTDRACSLDRQALSSRWVVLGMLIPAVVRRAL